jgi:HK97 gp10 family phage protein
MKATITMTKNVEEMMKRLGEDFSGGIRAGMTRTVEVIEARAVKETPVRTSNLVNSITSDVSADGKRGELRATADYAVFVHDGTGLYGPRKQKIVPKTARALKIPGIGYRKSTRGQKPQPFMETAREETDVQKEFESGMGGYLKAKGW